MVCDGDNCSGQAGIFAFIFTLGTIGNYTSNLPFGLLLDTRGPQACCVLAALVQLTGALAGWLDRRRKTCTGHTYTQRIRANPGMLVTQLVIGAALCRV